VGFPSPLPFSAIRVWLFDLPTNVRIAWDGLVDRPVGEFGVAVVLRRGEFRAATSLVCGEVRAATSLVFRSRRAWLHV
jgi:hypothetical protein